MFRAYLALAAAAIALAGCSGAEASTKVTSAATPSLPCSLPYGTDVALLEPSPGSTGVAPAGLTVLVGASRELPKTVDMVAIGAKGGVTAGVPLERVARPARVPHTAITPRVFYRVPGLALRTHRHYTVALDDVAQNGCAPYARLAGSARFST